MDFVFSHRHYNGAPYSTWTSPYEDIVTYDNGPPHYIGQHKYRIVRGTPYPIYQHAHRAHHKKPSVWLEYVSDDLQAGAVAGQRQRPVYPYFYVGWEYYVCSMFVVKALIDTLARLPNEADTAPQSPSPAVCTAVASVVGKVGYMAPGHSFLAGSLKARQCLVTSASLAAGMRPKTPYRAEA